MMELPLTVSVCCKDGACGRMTRLIVDLQAEQVTHLVVKLRGTVCHERLVPLRFVVQIAGELITLSCTAQELVKLPSFKHTEWIENAPGRYIPPLEQYLIHKALIRPYAHRQVRSSVPPGQIAVERGMLVETTNGQLGHVEKLLVQQPDGRIVRVVLRTGRPWRRKTTIVSFWRIARLGSERFNPTQNILLAEAAPTLLDVSMAGQQQ